MEKFLLIDGNSLLHRAYHATKAGGFEYTNSGVATNALPLFKKFIEKIQWMYDPTAMLITFDHPSETFRDALVDDYKATRSESDEELKQQFEVIKEYLMTYRIPFIDMAGYEADDIIGTVAKAQPKEFDVIIVSSDKDLKQLVTENIRYERILTGLSKIEHCNPDFIREKDGVEPLQLIDIKALMGDTGDNIKGVKGIGPKTALDLIQKYNSIDGIYENLSDIKPTIAQKLIDGKDDAYLSYQLGKIALDVPVATDIENYRLDKKPSALVLSVFNKKYSLDKK